MGFAVAVVVFFAGMALALAGAVAFAIGFFAGACLPAGTFFPFAATVNFFF